MWGLLRLSRAIWFKRRSVDEEIKAKPVPLSVPVGVPPKLAKPRLLTTAEIIANYGQPGIEKNLVHLDIPYPMRIAWDINDTVESILVHKDVAVPLHSVLTDLLAYYGYDKRVVDDRPTIKELGIDLYGGMYNKRPQRGLEKKHANAVKAGNTTLANTYLSRHSWATAIDLDPARNQLKETSKTARFARPEYKPMIDIFYTHGFISYGIERNNDWMHFEYGRLKQAA